MGPGLLTRSASNLVSQVGQLRAVGRKVGATTARVLRDFRPARKLTHLIIPPWPGDLRAVRREMET